VKSKTRKQPSDAELRAKAISRWENEGGALNPVSPAPDAVTEGAARQPDLQNRPQTLKRDNIPKSSVH
jgi:hypothetical protein